MKPARSFPFYAATALSTALLTLTIQPAGALDIWVKAPADGSGLWVDGVNWSNTVPPLGNEEARIDNGGTAVIDALQTDPNTGILGEISVGSITLGSQPTASGTLLMTGGKLTLTNTDFRIGGNPVVGIGGGVPTIGGTGVFTQTGGDVIQQGGNMNIGLRTNNVLTDTTVATGTYNLSGADSSYTVMFGFILAIGNRGTGTLNQSGGTIEVKNLSTTNGGTAGSLIQLGRNALNTTNSTVTNGTYNLSGGSATAALFRFGSNVQTLGTSTNTLNLSGTGKLQVGTIEISNTAATNNFNFTGGTLSAMTVRLPVRNEGGTLSPYTIDFTTVTADTGATITPVGTMTFELGKPYTQLPGATFEVDIAAPGINDFVDIGADASTTIASLEGLIKVNPLAFEPALGSFFDILTADRIVQLATVQGQTPAGNFFVPSVVTGTDGREVLRLTVSTVGVPEPGSLGLLGAATLALSLRRRRRTRV